MTATQTYRQLAVFTPFGADVLRLIRFRGREALSELFEYELEMLSSIDSLNPRDIVGQSVTWRIEEQAGEPRFFNGVVREFRNAGPTEAADETVYRVKVVPWLWLLKNTTDCRIFQHQNAPDIIESIFADLGMTDFDRSGLTRTYAVREFCVQYRESAFDFVSRLMEEEGIFYFIRHDSERHVLELADQFTSYFDLPDTEIDVTNSKRSDGSTACVTEWNHNHEFRPGRTAQRDFNFKLPRKRLNTTDVSELGLNNAHACEIYEYPGLYQDRDNGRQLTRIRLEEHEADQNVVSGKSTYGSFTPGGRFAVGQHLVDSQVGRQFTLKSVEFDVHEPSAYHTLSSDCAVEIDPASTDVPGEFTDESAAENADENAAEEQFQCRFECIPAEVTYRARRRTPKPVVEGPQTAVVVGTPGDEIFPDKHGRVKVQFPWDRRGDWNENSSCWIRVSQTHAGKGWGSIDLPRIGDEVIVSFLDGDPDRPIIKGRVYNGKNRPPFALPGGMTRSGGKSDTHKGSGYNEMSVDDTVGKEQIRANAQFNMDTAIGNNQTLKVGVDRTEDIGNNDSTTVAVDSSTDVGNNATVTVGNNTTYDVANNIVITAGTSITLKCGASTIHMNQAGVITVSGQFVTSAAMAMNNIVAPMTEIMGSRMLLQAGLINMKLGGVNHVKGKTVEVSGAKVDIRGGKTFIQGAPLKLGEAGAPTVSIPGAGGGGGAAADGGPTSGNSSPGTASGADGGNQPGDSEANESGASKTAGQQADADRGNNPSEAEENAAAPNQLTDGQDGVQNSPDANGSKEGTGSDGQTTNDAGDPRDAEKTDNFPSENGTDSPNAANDSGSESQPNPQPLPTPTPETATTDGEKRIPPCPDKAPPRTSTDDG
ncbi:MAG: type VI secretion system tip protein TssI/VgrG [Planctomycetota bacterium]|nr:type VI secretion system tip protein TssI/VgrG [Planctomycetota bacterium]